MVYLNMLGGLFLGLIIFIFTFIASKKSGKYYLAPIVTFLFSGIIVAYSLFIVRGFEGMGYLFVAGGFLFVSIVGTILLPILTRNKEAGQFNKRDKISLVILPIIFFATIGIVIFSEDGYWIIDQGRATPVEVEGYRTSTISEGRKDVTLLLGEDYIGKQVEVESVSKRGATEITLKFTDGEDDNRVPFIRIGIDEFNEPLKVQTTDGKVFESITDKINN